MNKNINQFSNYLLLYLVLIFLISLNTGMGQNKGTIIGFVRDEVTGEAIIGANVIIDSTTLGAATDLNGKFQIRNIEEGIYNIKVSHIAYQSKLMTNVEVKSDAITQLNLTLNSNVLETKEVLVVSKLDKSFENALLNLRKNSQNIIDGVSAEQIRKTTDV